MSPEEVISTSMELFGIDPNDVQNMIDMGISSFTLKGRTVGAENKYSSTYEHDAKGNKMTTYAYPAGPELARTRLVSASIRSHPFLEDAQYDDQRQGEEPLHLTGIEAQNQISKFLSESRADIEAASED